MNRPARSLAALAATALLALATPVRAAYQALEEIPVESPIRGWVQQLASSYGTGGSALHTWPWDRADLGRFLDALVAGDPAAAADPLVVRLRRELAPSDAPGGWEPALEADDPQGAVELSPYVRADYSDDRARGTIVRDMRTGLHGAYTLGGVLVLSGDLYAGTSSPGAHGNPVVGRHYGILEGQQLHAYFDRGTATLRGRFGRIEAGHTWLRWGPGRWGGMALADGAPAFDVLEARVPVVGVAQLEWFVASLDPGTETFLAGHRLEFHPGGDWDVAFGELARFDGTASVPLYFLPMIPYTVAERRVLTSSDVSADSLGNRGRNNVMWVADAAWRARPGLRLYGEVAVDDISFSSERRPREIAWQLGFESRRVLDGRPWTLSAEYARVYQYTYSSYHHEDFAFAGMPTGFELGPDVDRLNARLAVRPDPGWELGLEGAFTRKGEGALGDYYPPGTGHVNNLVLTGVLDVDTRGAATIDWSPAPGLSAGLTAGWARVRARDHVAGDDHAGAWLQTRTTLRW